MANISCLTSVYLRVFLLFYFWLLREAFDRLEEGLLSTTALSANFFLGGTMCEGTASIWKLLSLYFRAAETTFYACGGFSWPSYDAALI